MKDARKRQPALSRLFKAEVTAIKGTQAIVLIRQDPAQPLIFTCDANILAQHDIGPGDRFHLAIKRSGKHFIPVLQKCPRGTLSAKQVAKIRQKLKDI